MIQKSMLFLRTFKPVTLNVCVGKRVSMDNRQCLLVLFVLVISGI